MLLWYNLTIGICCVTETEGGTKVIVTRIRVSLKIREKCANRALSAVLYK